MKLFRLDNYIDTQDTLINFFTSKEAAQEYAPHNREVDVVYQRDWTEICEFTCMTTHDFKETIDGIVDREQGLKAWESGTVNNINYYV